MPVLQISDGKGNLGSFAQVYVMATMCYPDDEVRREQIAACLLMEIALKFESEEAQDGVFQMVVDTGLLPVIHLSPDPATLRKIFLQRMGRDSFLSGVLLLNLFSASEHHPELEMTLSKSVAAIAKDLELTDRTIWSAWGKFKNVAPLHAVKAIHESHRENPYHALTEDPIGFVGKAESFRRLAVRRGFLKHSEVWRQPEDLPNPADEEIPRLPDEAIRMLLKEDRFSDPD